MSHPPALPLANDTDGTVGPPRLVRRAALGLVWLAVVSGAIVFAEPAPVDILTILLIALLPVAGLVRISRGLVLFTALWIIAGAGALLATIAAPDQFLERAIIHTAISLYLYAALFVLAAFVARDPAAHAGRILDAYLVGATIAAVAGIAGYFALVPGADELFTKFTRAAGTFKDPNVFGAFLVPAAVYALHLMVSRPILKAIVPALLAGLLSIAILLSFSRGAWINLAVATVVYAYLAFVLAGSTIERIRLVALAAAAVVVGAIGLVVALEIPEVGRLLEDRASLTQSYDEGPEGRFGGQEKAKRLIADNPMGIGPLVFTGVYHSEDVHNVYLSMFLNAGWIGGFLYLMLVAMTCIYGFAHALKRTPQQPLFHVVYAAFLSQALEGMVIDTDHWRHFYLLMAVIWGLMTAPRAVASPIGVRPPRRPTIIGAVARDQPSAAAGLVDAAPVRTAADHRPILVPAPAGALATWIAQLRGGAGHAPLADPSTARGAIAAAGVHALEVGARSPARPRSDRPARYRSRVRSGGPAGSCQPSPAPSALVRCRTGPLLPGYRRQRVASLKRVARIVLH